MVIPSIWGITVAGFAVIIRPGPGPAEAVPVRPVDLTLHDFFDGM